MTSQPSRRALIMTVQWTLTIAVVGGMALVLASKWSQLQKLLTFSVTTVAIIAAGAVALFVFNGLVLQALARPFHLDMRFSEAFIIALVDATLNYLPLKAGTVATGTILWSRHRLAPTKFAAMIAGISITNMWTCTTIGSILLLIDGVAVPWAWALLIGPTVGVVFLVTWALRFDGHMPDTEHAHWFVRTMNRILDGIRVLFADVKLVGLVSFYNVMRILILAVQLMAAFSALSTPVTFSSTTIMASLATVLSTLSIIPGGLGFREGGVAGVAALLGMSATLGLAASVIERTVTMTMTALCGIPATVYISRTVEWSRLTRGDEEEQAA